VISIDIETASLVPERPEYALQPWRAVENKAQVTMIGAGTNASVKFVTVEQLNAMPKTTLVAWNAVFDCAWLHAIGVDVARHDWCDAMLLCKWYENCQDNDILGYSLAACAERHLKGWEHLEKFLKLKNADLSNQPESYWRVRCALDVTATHLLALMMQQKLTPRQLASAHIEAGNIVPNAKSWVYGVPTDPKAYDDPIPEIIAQMAEIECRLGVSAAAQTNALAARGGQGWVPSPILRSPQKLSDTLYKVWKLPVQRETPKGAPSTDKAALTYLADTNDNVLEILAWRELNTRLTKFCQSPSKASKYLGSSRLHPEPKIFSTYTGRYTYGSKSGKPAQPIAMALHQMPRGEAVRRMVAAEEDKLLFEFDASGQEARLIAEIGDVHSMLDVFRAKKKIHAVTGAAIAGINYDEFMKRYAAKEPAYAGPEGLYYAGKFCVAEGQLVDTGRGLIAIENVTVDDLVWDGVEYVRHDGVVCNGVKEVIEVDGVTATPDHKVLTHSGWRELQDVKENEILRAYPREDRRENRSLDDHRQQILGGRERSSKASLRQVLPVSMQVRCNEVRAKEQLREQQDFAVQELCAQSGRGRSLLLSSVSRYCRSMYQQAKSKLSQLWWAGDYSGVQECAGVLPAHEDCIPRRNDSGFKNTGYRSQGQQSWIRAREHQAFDSQREQPEHKAQPSSKLSRAGCLYRRLVASTKARLSRLCVLKAVDGNTGKYGTVDRGSAGARPNAEVPRRQVRVYDIINAGPRHRFTIQGKIVSNCNLSMQYRVGVSKQRVIARVQYGLKKDVTTIERWRAAYHTQYPEIKSCWGRLIARARVHGYAESLAGRRYYLTKWGEADRWSTESSAINDPIQASGGDMKNLAITTVARKHPEAQFAWDLHDGVFYWLPRTREGLQLAREILHTLNTLDYESAWGWKPRIEMPWEAAAGTTWGNMRGFN
jgi:DNA polymerase I-like protein with 3'-5' exonuclease and polymerase domains